MNNLLTMIRDGAEQKDIAEMAARRNKLALQAVQHAVSVLFKSPVTKSVDFKMPSSWSNMSNYSTLTSDNPGGDLDAVIRILREPPYNLSAMGKNGDTVTIAIPSSDYARGLK